MSDGKDSDPTPARLLTSAHCWCPKASSCSQTCVTTDLKLHALLFVRQLISANREPLKPVVVLNAGMGDPSSTMPFIGSIRRGTEMYAEVGEWDMQTSQGNARLENAPLSIIPVSSGCVPEGERTEGRERPEAEKG